MTSPYLAAALAALATTLPALARAEDSPPTPDVAGREVSTGVSELVVTATRSPQPADKVGASVTVIDHAQILARQVVVVSDVLATLPGISVQRSGGVGEATTLRIRGAEGGQTVVVVDGVKLNDPTGPDSAYNFGNLLTGDVARIEVLRGAQSTLWGSQAIGGVVNIVTADPTRPFEGEASLEGGSMGTAYGRAAIGGVADRLVWRLAASQYATDGVSAFAQGQEKDGYRNTGLSGRANLKLTDTVSLDLRGVWSRGRNQFDGFPPPLYQFADDAEYGITKDLTAYAGLNFDLLEGRLRNRVAYGYTRTDLRYFDPTQAVTTVTFDARGENRTWEYQGIFQASDAWTATLGAAREESTMRAASPSSFDPHPTPGRGQAAIDSLYGQANGEIAKGLTLTLGLRHDRHDTFGDHSLGQVAAAWSLNDGATVLRASFGQGFKAPSLYQLFSEFGNTTLKPESADSWDASVTQRFASGRSMVQAAWFQRATDNQIDFFSCLSPSTPLCAVGGGRFGYYANIAQTKAHGIELVGQAHLAGLDLDGNYTWTHTENDAAGPNRGRDLARRPGRQANLTAGHAWASGLSASATVSYVGESFDDAANSVRLKAYALVGLRVSYPVTPSTEVYGRVENALDETYQTVGSYGHLGRGAYLGVRARF